MVCEGVPGGEVLGAEPYVCPPWVSEPNVVVYEGGGEALTIIEDYKPG